MDFFKNQPQRLACNRVTVSAKKRAYKFSIPEMELAGISWAAEYGISYAKLMMIAMKGVVEIRSREEAVLIRVPLKVIPIFPDILNSKMPDVFPIVAFLRNRRLGAGVFAFFRFPDEPGCPKKDRWSSFPGKAWIHLVCVPPPALVGVSTSKE